MKLKSYNILFRIFSYLSDKTNGAPLFVKYKLLLGTLILGLAGTTAHAQKKEVAKDTLSTTPATKEIITCYKLAIPSKSDNEKIVQGCVTDEGGEPIIGVTVRIKDSQTGITTDIDGNFSLKAKTTDILVFTYLGMETKEVSVSILNSKDTVIRMKESNIILCYEVVVVKQVPVDDIYRRSPRKITKLSYTEVKVQPVSPVGDLAAFQDWVQGNIVYSEQMLKDKVEGEVLLSFAIDKKGKVVDKKILTKLSKEADKEALRALSLSGLWKPGYDSTRKPIKTTMTISVKFILP